MHQDDLKEKDKFILFFKIVLGKIASAARNLIHSSPQTEATTFAFSSVFILLLHMTVGHKITDKGEAIVAPDHHVLRGP